MLTWSLSREKELELEALPLKPNQRTAVLEQRRRRRLLAECRVGEGGEADEREHA